MGPIFSLVGSTFAFVVEVFQVVGLPGLFALMFVASVGIPPLPSEVILPFAGVLLADGTPYFTWESVVLVALSGTLLGAFAGYAIGRAGGHALLRRWGSRLGLGERDLARAEDYFARRGSITVFLCQMVPLARSYIAYPAGAAEMDGTRFGLYTALGAFPFIVVMVYLGTVLGKEIGRLEPYFNVLDVVVVALAVGVVIYYWRRIVRERAGIR